MTTFDLSTVREKIDALDEQLQLLLTQRANLALQVAKAKRAEEANPVFYRPEREADVLRRAIVRNQGPLSDAFIEQFFREIMSACLALQFPLKVAYLGPPGTFSEAAVKKQFGQAVESLPLVSIEEVFRSVASGAAQYGVVPVENSTEGGVSQTLDLFLKSSVLICGEVELEIHQHLMAQNEHLDSIKTVYSHQQSLAQCRLWLGAHLPNAERVRVMSNAEAARCAAQEQHAAAIAGRIAADNYGLTVLAENIEDELDNTTRFAIIGQHPVAPTGKDKTSLVITAADATRSGALYELLAPFKEAGLSMSRIESRPSRQNRWHYVFFIDVEGHIEEAKLQQVMQTLEQHSGLLKHLGSYPRALG